MAARKKRRKSSRRPRCKRVRIKGSTRWMCPDRKGRMRFSKGPRGRRRRRR